MHPSTEGIKVCYCVLAITPCKSSTNKQHSSVAVIRIEWMTLISKPICTDTHTKQILNTQQTKDLEFDKEVDKFRAMQRCAAVLSQDLDALLQGVKARHRGELGVVKGFIEVLQQAGVEVKSLHGVAVDSAGRLFETFVIHLTLT